MKLRELIERLKRGQEKKKREIEIKIKERSEKVIKIIKILEKEGLIRGYEIEKGKIKIWLKYKEGKGIIKEIKEISKGSQRIYIKKKELKEYNEIEKDILILSTKKGILENKEELGGEILIKIKR